MPRGRNTHTLKLNSLNAPHPTQHLAEMASAQGRSSARSAAFPPPPFTADETEYSEGEESENDLEVLHPDHVSSGLFRLAHAQHD